MIELRGESVGGCESESLPAYDEGDWEPIESGCMRAMVYGFLGMAGFGFVVLGIVTAWRWMGR